MAGDWATHMTGSETPGQGVPWALVEAAPAAAGELGPAAAEGDAGGGLGFAGGGRGGLEACGLLLCGCLATSGSFSGSAACNRAVWNWRWRGLGAHRCRQSGLWARGDALQLRFLGSQQTDGNSLTAHTMKVLFSLLHWPMAVHGSHPGVEWYLLCSCCESHDSFPNPGGYASCEEHTGAMDKVMELEGSNAGVSQHDEALPGHALQHVSMSTRDKLSDRSEHAREPATIHLLDMGRRSQEQPGRATLFSRSTRLHM